MVAPRPPYSFGQEIPAQPARCSWSCHSRRKAITSSRPASGSGPGWFSCSQERTSSRNSSSDGDSVRSIESGAYRDHLAAWPGDLRSLEGTVEADGLGFLFEVLKVVGFRKRVDPTFFDFLDFSRQFFQHLRHLVFGTL